MVPSPGLGNDGNREENKGHMPQHINEGEKGEEEYRKKIIKSNTFLKKPFLKFSL